MIGTGAKGTHHSSFTPYSSRIAGLVCKSLKAAQSSGESDGTEVTIPVPLVIEIVFIGKAYTFSYGARGAFNYLPISSRPVSLARAGYFPYSTVSS